MPSILSDADRETVKRTVPKASNKIQAVAVARLYVAYPNRQRWTYTGLQGAVVLANDLIGNTYWIKLVDVSPANRGVIWDQEIYDQFFYNQDRTFFHSFELEDCLAGLSFVDEKEARTFKKKMDERERNAHKDTRNTPFQGGYGASASAPTSEKIRTRLTNLIHGKSSSSPAHNTATHSFIPPKETHAAPSPEKKSALSALDQVDPSWRDMLSDLIKLGITEDQIEENADFIKSYVEQRRAETLSGPSSGLQDSRPKAPPPPPPPAPPSGHKSLSPQNTGSSRRGPPPAPPPSRRSRTEQKTSPLPKQSDSQKSPERTPSPPRPTFKVPPPFPDAGSLARNKPPSATSIQGPLPPPRPPKNPVNEDEDSKPKFGVAPPFVGERIPPPMRASAGPSRSPVPAPPPRTTPDSKHAVPPVQATPPPLPPKIPPSASVNAAGAPPPPPPLPPQRTVPISSSGPPTAPPPPPARILPPTSGPPPPPPPPPPPLTVSGLAISVGDGPPQAPPLPPGRNKVPDAPTVTQPSGGNNALLVSIRESGGFNGGGLRQLKDSEKRDRSAAMVPGSDLPKPSGGGGAAGGTGGGTGGGGIADAIASALNKRKQVVSASDDEDDSDDWDYDAPKRRQ